MIIYPAIDLLNQKCVRLRQGKYDEVTVYHEHPEEVAQSFKEAGSEWIHMVDLNAAKSGVPENREIVARIARETGLRIQTGGGIRNMESLQYLLGEIGVARCVIGTSAIRDREFTERALARYGDRIAIGLDAKDGEVAVDGWTVSSGVPAAEFAKQMMKLGARIFIYTDIARDGMLQGPAVESTKQLIADTGAEVIASGGIGAQEDVGRIRESGCCGVIIGKAIYEGKVRLEKCFQRE